MKRMIVKKIVLASAMTILVLSMIGCGESNDTDNSSSNSKCNFTNSDGTICGETVTSHDTMCDYHFDMVESNYEFYFGPIE